MAENTYNIARAKGAEVYELTYSNADLAATFEFTENSWQPSMSDGVVNVGEYVSPGEDSDGVSIAGYWLASISILPGTTVSSAHPRWEGEGDFTVSYTLDGSTWIEIANGEAIDLEDITDPDLDFRVDFAGGTLDDEAKLTRLTVYVLASETLKSSNQVRALSFDKATLSETVGTQVDPRDDEGSVLRGGYLSILPDPNTEQVVNRKTVEFWARLDDATGILMSSGGASVVSVTSNALNAASATVQINGVTRSNGYTIPAGWNFWHIELGTASNVEIRIGASIDGSNRLDMAVFGLALYSDVPSGTYEPNVGAPAIRVDDVGTISVSQPEDSVDIYAYAWSITSTTR